MCQEGKANRYDVHLDWPIRSTEQRLWADQVPRVQQCHWSTDEEAESSSVPQKVTAWNIHQARPSPEDCRQYYLLCIGGIPESMAVPWAPCSMLAVAMEWMASVLTLTRSRSAETTETRHLDPRTLANQGFDTGSRLVMWRRDPGAATLPDKEQHPQELQAQTSDQRP